MTYLFVNVTYWNCWPIPYVDQVWWWYVKAFMSYAWQNWQTNRQTDRQTDKRTYLQISSKFWQVINRTWICCSTADGIVTAGSRMQNFNNVLLLLYVMFCDINHFKENCDRLYLSLVNHTLCKTLIFIRQIHCKIQCVVCERSFTQDTLSSNTTENLFEQTCSSNNITRHSNVFLVLMSTSTRISDSPPSL